jgi:hypothetical protein
MDGAQVRSGVVGSRTHYVDSGETYQITFQVVMPDGRIAWGTTTPFEAKFYKDYVFTFTGAAYPNPPITCSDSSISLSWVNAVLVDGLTLLTGESIYPDPGSPQRPLNGLWVYYDPNTDYGIGYGLDPIGDGSNPSLSVQQ